MSETGGMGGMARLLLLLAFAGGGAYLQYQWWQVDAKQAQVARETAALQQENSAQQAKNAQLKQRIDDIRQHPDEIFEELAREKLFMIKPGEIYILPQSEAS